jgi:GMP synthase-like glutamine amidotransferase
MPAGHPGIFQDLLRRDGVGWQALRLDLGESIPDLAGFAALWVMGGPQDVWEEEEHPWLRAEKAAIREAVRVRRMPFLGICLGHQLLADALGGMVGKAAAAEIGVHEVALAAGAAGHPLLAGLPACGPVLQWHRAEVRRPPAGARCSPAPPAARSKPWRSPSARSACRATSRSTPRRSRSGWRRRRPWPSWNERSGRTGRPASPPRRAHMAACNRAARRLYANFMTLVSAAARTPA